VNKIAIFNKCRPGVKSS